MNKVPQVKLTWHGRETVEAVVKFISDVREIEIELPFNYNHALFHTLNPQASPSVSEDLDITGGPELLAKIATVHGLEELEGLIEALKKVNATVQLVSPPTITIKSL